MRIEPQRFAVTSHGRLGSALILTDHPEGIVHVRKRRIDQQRSPATIRRLLELALSPQCIGEVIERVGVMRVYLQCALEAGLSFLELSQVFMRNPQVIMQASVAGNFGERLLITRRRLREQSLFTQQPRQLQRRVDKKRVEAHGLTVASLGLPLLSFDAKNVAEIEVIARRARVGAIACRMSGTASSVRPVCWYRTPSKSRTSAWC